MVGVSLAILATVLRFVATKVARHKYGAEDWCAVLATFFFIAYVTPLLYLVSVMNGRSTTELTSADVVKMTKIFRKYPAREAVESERQRHLRQRSSFPCRGRNAQFTGGFCSYWAGGLDGAIDAD
ncbi:uncharacterized protein LY89DRAFT_687351 [Mollisia scopiformis]|uniref:Uncharacterized protein n=1 Tax=Mollisia scopiformis TaxID=149040 RepID=A0A194X2N9_MOLSC|nr:uncharacterized protein LY89DRAFT_687351 [Mollisia scopiformis]KUJ14102.1 hypothetical protein LY89DRAFT_687351 [Mollisia scopiformis]